MTRVRRHNHWLIKRLSHVPGRWRRPVSEVIGQLMLLLRLIFSLTRSGRMSQVEGLQQIRRGAEEILLESELAERLK
jgi:hypothetical protein